MRGAHGGRQSRVAPAVSAVRNRPPWPLGERFRWTPWVLLSTVGDLFAREGLVTKRRRRRPHQHPGVVPPVTTAPNELWTANFKGQFPTQDGVWCYPLTIGDQHTRYLLACRRLPNIKGRGARPIPSSCRRSSTQATSS